MKIEVINKRKEEEFTWEEIKDFRSTVFKCKTQSGAARFLPITNAICIIGPNGIETASDYLWKKEIFEIIKNEVITISV